MQSTQQLVEFPLPEHTAGNRQRGAARGQQRRASQSVIGKTVTGVISRPVSGGRESLLMLQFSDGTCFEFVSPAAQRALNRRGGQPAAGSTPDDSLQQLSFFPHDGNPAASSAPVF